MSGYNCGYSQCEEYAALRAEVAALRGSVRELLDGEKHLEDRAESAERALADARALLARWLPLAWQCAVGLLEDTRAFLAGSRDEGPRSPHNHPMNKWGCPHHALGCDECRPARDEALRSQECVCQPSYYQDGVVETHGPTCPASDEGGPRVCGDPGVFCPDHDEPPCLCGEPLRQGQHHEDCPARDEARGATDPRFCKRCGADHLTGRDGCRPRAAPTEPAPPRCTCVGWMGVDEHTDPACPARTGREKK